MGSRIEGVLKNIGTITNAAGNPPHCPDGVWFESASTQAEILAETSVTGGQLKMSNGGKLFLSDANDGKYHDVSVRSYGSVSITLGGLGFPANTPTNIIAEADSVNAGNRAEVDAVDDTIYIPPVWGPVLFTLRYTFNGGFTVNNTELAIQSTSGTTGTMYEWGGPGLSGTFTFEANLFPEFKPGSSVDQVTMTKHPLKMLFSYQGVNGGTSVSMELSWASLPGCLISSG